MRTVVRALVGILTLVSGSLTLAQPPDRQPPQSIRDAARDLVLERLGTAAATVEAVGVDERVRLPLCTVPLSAHAHSELRNGGGTVAIACEGAQPWRLYVPVRITAQLRAVAAAHAIPAGATIAASDLVLETRSTATLPYEYLTDAAQAVGATVKRTIPAGTVLVRGALSRSIAIERGALVTLVAKSGPVQVRTEGVALEAAHLDERVRVRSRSGRVVEGVAAAGNEVHVGT